MADYMAELYGTIPQSAPTPQPTVGAAPQSVATGGAGDMLGLTTDYTMPYTRVDRSGINTAAALDAQARQQQLALALQQYARATGEAPSVAGQRLAYGMGDTGAQAAQQAASIGGANRGLGAVQGARMAGAGAMQVQEQGVADRLSEFQRALGQAQGLGEQDLGQMQARLRAAQADQESYLTTVEANRQTKEANKAADDATMGALLQAGGTIAGGAAGFMLGGPAGAVGGAALGNAAGRGLAAGAQ